MAEAKYSGWVLYDEPVYGISVGLKEIGPSSMNGPIVCCIDVPLGLLGANPFTKP